MQAITLLKKKYTLSDDIIKNVPIWCKGVRNGRELVKKKLIDNKYFIYARYIDGEWIENEGKSVKYDKATNGRWSTYRRPVTLYERSNGDIIEPCITFWC